MKTWKPSLTNPPTSCSFNSTSDRGDVKLEFQVFVVLGHSQSWVYGFREFLRDSALIAILSQGQLS